MIYILQELHQALRDVIPADITLDDVVQLCSLAGVQPINGVDDKLFVGLAALADRIFQTVGKAEW
jgi:hypothetical protein